MDFDIFWEFVFIMVTVPVFQRFFRYDALVYGGCPDVVVDLVFALPRAFAVTWGWRFALAVNGGHFQHDGLLSIRRPRLHGLCDYMYFRKLQRQWQERYSM